VLSADASTAIAAHRSNYPDPIEFHQGDSLKTGIRDSEYEGWVRVTTTGGKEGWAQEQYLEQVSATTQLPCVRIPPGNWIQRQVSRW